MSMGRKNRNLRNCRVMTVLISVDRHEKLVNPRTAEPELARLWPPASCCYGTPAGSEGSLRGGNLLRGGVCCSGRHEWRPCREALPLTQAEREMADLILGAGHIDRRLPVAEDLLAGYRTDDGLRYLDWRPSTDPYRLMPEDLAVTILINSRVGPAAFKSAQDRGPELDLARLPDMPLEETSADVRGSSRRSDRRGDGMGRVRRVSGHEGSPQEAPSAHPDLGQPGDLRRVYEPKVARATIRDGQRLCGGPHPRCSGVDLDRPHATREHGRLDSPVGISSRNGHESSYSTWCGGCIFVDSNPCGRCRLCNHRCRVIGVYNCTASEACRPYTVRLIPHLPWPAEPR